MVGNRSMNSPSAKPERQPRFAPYPSSWYYLCHRREIDRGPVRFQLPEGPSFVGYRTASGRLAVLSASCSHLGADLSRGEVSGEIIRCPFHGWEYNATGACTRIPVSTEIPAFARQLAYPVEERGGHVFFFNQPQPRFPLPFFDGKQPEQLLSARSFDLVGLAPWYLIGANGFDVQHFASAHDRELIEEPVLDFPDPFACRIRVRLRVAGASWRDRLTRKFAGKEVTLTVTDWCGNLNFVSAEFQHTTSYGMVSLTPLEDARTLARIVIWVPRSRSRLGRLIVDGLDAWLRRWFIREFLRSDVDRLFGVRYHPTRLIAADRLLSTNLEWLMQVHRDS
jgi:nitrite reductase/ring-hydroxylating ferredoxin subunit